MLRLGHYKRAKKLLDEPQFISEVGKLKAFEQDGLKLADAMDCFDEDISREMEQLSKLVRRIEKKAQRHGLVVSVSLEYGGLRLAISDLIKKWSLPTLESTELWIRRLLKKRCDPFKSGHTLIYSPGIEEEEKREFTVLISDFDSDARLRKLLKFLKERKYWQPSKKGAPKKRISDWQLGELFKKHYHDNLSEDEILSRAKVELDQLKRSGQIDQTYKLSTIKRKYRDWKPDKRSYEF